jgi:hypothetical protein
MPGTGRGRLRVAVKLARPHGQRRKKYGTLIPTAIIGLPGPGGF